MKCQFHIFIVRKTVMTLLSQLKLIQVPNTNSIKFFERFDVQDSQKIARLTQIKKMYTAFESETPKIFGEES